MVKMIAVNLRHKNNTYICPSGRSYEFYGVNANMPPTEIKEKEDIDFFLSKNGRFKIVEEDIRHVTETVVEKVGNAFKSKKKEKEIKHE